LLVGGGCANGDEKGKKGVTGTWGKPRRFPGRQAKKKKVAGPTIHPLQGSVGKEATRSRSVTVWVRHGAKSQVAFPRLKKTKEESLAVD